MIEARSEVKSLRPDGDEIGAKEPEGSSLRLRARGEAQDVFSKP